MSINELGCAPHPMMWPASIRCRYPDWMRHASKGVSKEVFLSRLKFQLLLDAPCIHGCGPHRKKSMAENALHDKEYLDAPHIHRCVTHPNLALPDYKTDRGQFLRDLSVFPPFPPKILRSRFWDWDLPFSHLERVLLVLGILIFAGFAGSDDCIWIVKNWRQRAAEHEIRTKTCLLRVFLFFTLLFLYFSWFDWKNVRSGHVWLSFL